MSYLALGFLLERLKGQRGQLDELGVILSDRDAPLRYKTSLRTIVYGMPKAWRFQRVFVSSKMRYSCRTDGDIKILTQLPSATAPSHATGALIAANIHKGPGACLVHHAW